MSATGRTGSASRTRESTNGLCRRHRGALRVERRPCGTPESPRPRDEVPDARHPGRCAQHVRRPRPEVGRQHAGALRQPAARASGSGPSTRRSPIRRRGDRCARSGLGQPAHRSAYSRRGCQPARAQPAVWSFAHARHATASVTARDIGPGAACHLSMRSGSKARHRRRRLSGARRSLLGLTIAVIWKAKRGMRVSMVPVHRWQGSCPGRRREDVLLPAAADGVRLRAVRLLLGRSEGRPPVRRRRVDGEPRDDRSGAEAMCGQERE